MRKIPTLFMRLYDGTLAHQFHPDVAWVISGNGIATRKYDGTCVMLDEQGAWWARREVKPDAEAPEGFYPVETDDETGKTVGWEPIEQSGFHKHFLDALDHTPVLPEGEPGPAYPPGTYELCGPKVNSNPEKFEHHVLVSHETAQVVPFPPLPEDPESAIAIVEAIVGIIGMVGWEGIVWHHADPDDPRMAKIKARDFR